MIEFLVKNWVKNWRGNLSFCVLLYYSLDISATVRINSKKRKFIFFARPFLHIIGIPPGSQIFGGVRNPQIFWGSKMHIFGSKNGVVFGVIFWGQKLVNFWVNFGGHFWPPGGQKRAWHRFFRGFFQVFRGFFLTFPIYLGGSGGSKWGQKTPQKKNLTGGVWARENWP